MLDGLWVVEFKANNNYGSGVLVINGNQVMGGDFGYYYVGQIDTTNGLTGEIDVVRFNPNAISVFGDIGNFTLLLKNGQITEQNFSATGLIKGAEQYSLEIKGLKKVDAK